MTKEQMQKTLKDVELLERDLMRDLTEKEIEIVKTYGFKELLFNHLCMTDKTYKIMRKISRYISAVFTEGYNEIEYAKSQLDEDCIQLLHALADRATEYHRKMSSYNPEEADAGLNDYFNENSTKEADEAQGIYDPEHDKELFDSSEDKEEDEISQYKEAILDALNGKSVKMSDEAFDLLCDLLEKNCLNYSIQNINGNVTVKAL